MTVQDIAKEGTQDSPTIREIKLQDLKAKSPTELLAFAEEHDVENGPGAHIPLVFDADSSVFGSSTALGSGTVRPPWQIGLHELQTWPIGVLLNPLLKQAAHSCKRPTPSSALCA